MKKTSLLALGLALAVGVVAEAGSIPTDRVPLQTYAIKKVDCYLQPNGTQKGWIDPGDYVIVTQIRSDGWAYGSYPVGKGRTSRWFRVDELVNNTGFANQERYSPKANTYTYTNPNHNKQFGSFNNNEPILVVSDSGQSRQFIYKLNSGGYKMAWVPYWDCWDARQAGKQQVNNNTINTNPIVKPVKREEKKQERSSSYGVWKTTARYRANTYDNPNLSGARAGWVTAGSNLEVLGENSKSYYIRYWTDNGSPRERYVERTAVKGLNEKNEINDKKSPSGYYYPLGSKSYFKNSDGNNNYKNHDCMQAEGTPVYATFDGTAEFRQIIGYYKGKYTTVSYGNVIYLTAPGKKVTYAHLSRFNGISLKYKGETNYGSSSSSKYVSNIKRYLLATKQVKAGELIGYVGAVGHASGSHLHLELYVNGVRQEPNDYFNK